MTHSPRATILPAIDESGRIPPPTIPRSLPPPLPMSASSHPDDEDLPHEDPIAYLGTSQHPLSTPPTVLDLEPLSRASSPSRPPAHPKARIILQRVAVTALAGLVIAPVFLGLSAPTVSPDAGQKESAVAGVSASTILPKGPSVASVGDAVDAPDEQASAKTEAAFVQMPPLEITARPAEVLALRRAAREPRNEPPTLQARAMGPAFDFNGAMNAVVAAEIGSRQCGAEAVGAAAVAITFAPSGRATRAVVEGGPLRGTEAGSCIAMHLRDVQVAPFQGDLATVRTTVFLR